MQAITSSAEHHFLTTLEKLRTDQPKHWLYMRFEWSVLLRHDDLILKPYAIPLHIENAVAKIDHFIEQFKQEAHFISVGFVYRFMDGDVAALLHIPSEAEKHKALEMFKNLARVKEKLGCEVFGLDSGMYQAMKTADLKMLVSKRFASYTAMGDEHKVSSIGIRRARRESPIVLLIEDDRFTASYASNILNKHYDLIVSRSGEEGISAYIEHAPDIVFLDIHLPGLSGHETLHAIKAVDPESFVVMLSVDTAKDSIVQAAQTGAKNFLKKPFSKERLISVVKNSPFIRSNKAGFISHETAIH
jgi:two-component system chemotaxis response regulator CheY